MEQIPRTPRPCEIAPHTLSGRLEKLILKTNSQVIDSTLVSRKLGISRKQAGQLLRVYIEEEDL